MTEAYEYPAAHLALRTGNLPRACAFYAELLGWGPGAGRHRGGFLPGASDGGLGGGLVACERQRAVWLPYVEVDDIAAVTDRAHSLGASVRLEPREGPAGWRSVVASPAGGEIALWQPKSQAIDRDPARPRTSTTEGNAR